MPAATETAAEVTSGWAPSHASSVVWKVAGTQAAGSVIVGRNAWLDVFAPFGAAAFVVGFAAPEPVAGMVVTWASGVAKLRFFTLLVEARGFEAAAVACASVITVMERPKAASSVTRRCNIRSEKLPGAPRLTGAPPWAGEKPGAAENDYSADSVASVQIAGDSAVPRADGK